MGEGRRTQEERASKNSKLPIVRDRGGRGSSVFGQGCAEGLLGGVDHVEEAVVVLLALVHLRDHGRHRDHAVAVDQQEEGLVGVELKAPPDDLDEFTHVNVVGHQEFGLVQNGELLFPHVSLDDHRYLVGVLLSDQSHIFYSLFVGPPLFEGFFRRHIASSDNSRRGAETAEQSRVEVNKNRNAKASKTTTEEAFVA